MSHHLVKVRTILIDEATSAPADNNPERHDTVVASGMFSLEQNHEVPGHAPFYVYTTDG
jgi:hypothetical protein